MTSIERKTENYAVIFNVNLVRATLNEASEFKDYIAETIQDSDKDLIVNLSACEHLDSTFLGVLVSAYKKLKSQNRTLVIIEPIDQSSIFLTLNSIGKIFPMYTSVKAAVEDLENKRLLEKEINELNNEQEELIAETAEDFSKMESETVVEDSISSMKDEAVEVEMNTETILTEESNALNEITQELQNESNSVEWNLIEHNSEETERANTADFSSEESVTDLNEIKYNPDEDEESQTVIKHTREIEENDFSGNGVKWEFGFSS